MKLTARSDVSLAVAMPWQLQLCTLLGISPRKLLSFYNTNLHTPRHNKNYFNRDFTTLFVKGLFEKANYSCTRLEVLMAVHVQCRPISYNFLVTHHVKIVKFGKCNA